MAMMRLQMNYWDERMGVLASQVQELHALSAELVANTADPIREHVRRSRSAKAA
jgi:hypothetical protein